MNTCVRSDHVAHLIVFEANYCVGNLVETSQSFARLGVATPAFERKRQRCERKHQGSRLASKMSDIRRRARSRGSTQPSTDEDHPRPSQCLADLLCRFKSGLIADLGVATCAQATGDCPPELYFVRGHGTRSLLH